MAARFAETDGGSGSMSVLARDAAIAQVGNALAARVSVLRGLRSVSNSAWLIDIDGTRAVLRLHTLGFGQPVTDHAREIEIHQLAAQAGLSPAIVYSDVERNILITEFIDSGTFTKRAAILNASLAPIGECLARLHAVEVPPWLVGYSLADAAHTYLKRAGINDDPKLRALEYTVQQSEALAHESQRVLCHRDLLYSNILNTRPVQLIDWEFASPGERWFDLAAMIAWHKLSKPKQRRLMDAYLGRPPIADEIDAVQRNIMAFDALCTLWSLPAAD